MTDTYTFVMRIISKYNLLTTSATTALLFFVAYWDSGNRLLLMVCFIKIWPSIGLVLMLKSASRRCIVLSLDSSQTPGIFSSSTFNEDCHRLGE